MRTHEQIIRDVGSPSSMAKATGATPGAVKQWRKNSSIPGPYWQAVADHGWSTLEELAAAVAKPANDTQERAA